MASVIFLAFARAAIYPGPTTDTERAKYEALVSQMMALLKAKNTLIAELEREVAALRERLAGVRPN